MRVNGPGRPGGKTTALIREMADDPDSVMLCASQNVRTHAENLAGRMYPEIKWHRRFQVFTTNIGANLRGASKIYIDDLDLILHSVLRLPIEAASITGELLEDDELDRQYLRELLEEQQRG